jgi:hypothetical protein
MRMASSHHRGKRGDGEDALIPTSSNDRRDGVGARGGHAMRGGLLTPMPDITSSPGNGLGEGTTYSNPLGMKGTFTRSVGVKVPFMRELTSGEPSGSPAQ